MNWGEGTYMPLLVATSPYALRKYTGSQWNCLVRLHTWPLSASPVGLSRSDRWRQLPDDLVNRKNTAANDIESSAPHQIRRRLKHDIFISHRIVPPIAHADAKQFEADMTCIDPKLRPRYLNMFLSLKPDCSRP
jgi:hypothetical protein